MDKMAMTPTLCRGKDAPFSGDVVLTRPTFDESFGYLEELQDVLEFDESGQLKNEGDVMKNISAMRRIVRCSEPHWDKVKIKKADGSEYKSFDQLSRDRDAYPILIEVAFAIVFGQQPEKN